VQRDETTLSTIGTSGANGTVDHNDSVGTPWWSAISYIFMSAHCGQKSLTLPYAEISGHMG
jgi:hypothetical protein